MTALLIVDDHAAVRTGLAALVEPEPGLHVVAAVADAREAIAAVGAHRPDIAIVDFHLPDEDGLRLCLRLSEMSPRPQLVIYSAFADEVLGVLGMVAGADAVLSKATDPGRVVSLLRDLAAGVHAEPEPPPAAMSAVAEALETGDLPILAMLVHGTPPAQIAATLGVTDEWLLARRWAILRSLSPRRTRRGMLEPAPR